MIRFALSTLLIGAILTTYADEAPQRSIFSYSKEIGLSSQLRAVQDLVILRDGSLIQVELSSIPSLRFTFGTVDLSLDEISMVTTIKEADPKLKILMRSGEVYVGTPEHFSAAFVEKHGIDATGKLDLKEVDSILVKPRKKREESLLKNQLRVSLRNGEQFPVEIADRYIELSDGWSVKRIERHQVVDLYFNGGLYGTISNDHGEEELPLSFVKQQSIHFVAPIGNHHIQLPWKLIAQLSKSSDHTVGEQYALIQESKEDAPVIFAAEHPKDIIHEVEFLKEPLPIFAQSENWELPEEIVFLEETKPLFDRKDLDELEKMFAVGEDFDFDGWDTTTGEQDEEDNDVEFISQCEGDQNGFCLAVGEDFDLDGLEETVEDQAEDTIEFVSREEEQAVSDQPLAYRGCHCVNTDNAKPMPHADFSMDDEKEEVEQIMIEEDVRDVDWLKMAKPAIPEIPNQNQRQKEIEKRTVPSRLDFGSPLAPSVIASAPAREFDGLIYIPTGHADGSGFYIKPDKVTNREYKKFVDAINYRTPLHWVGNAIPKGMEDEPVVNVSYRDAFLYSVWAGKRLPTEEEMVRAVEAGKVLKDPDNDTAEWTSTPTLRSVRYPQSGSSVKIGQTFSPSHQVFSRYRIVSMSNDDSNNYTGFRTAIDGH